MSASPTLVPSRAADGGGGVLSPDNGARWMRWHVHALNANAWCSFPGNPFQRTLRLKPNPPAAERVTVTFGTERWPPAVDSVTWFLRSGSTPMHENRHRVEVALLDSSRDVRATETTTLGCGEQRTLRLSVDRPLPGWTGLRMAVEFERYEEGSPHGNVQLPYLLAFRNNELIELCDALGTDKGTERAFGGAVPHCYASAYFDLFAHLRAQRFSLLEIGLEDDSKDSGEVRRAPSLEVWRRFFPKADLYGFDINDFASVRQDRTVTFQGDQSSREDLERFLRTWEPPDLGLVLDDGSHASSHQQISLAALFPAVRPGGMYVIEDLHWQPFPETPTTVEVLRAFMASGRFESPFVTRAEASYLEKHIAGCRIHKPNDAEFAVLTKAGEADG